MGIIKKILGIKSSNTTNDIIEENKQIKRELEELKVYKNEITAKYIELLEEKEKGFDKYLRYQKLYEDICSKMKKPTNKNNKTTKRVKKSVEAKDESTKK